MEKTDVRYQLCRLSTSDTLKVNAAVCCGLDSTVIQISFLTPKTTVFSFFCDGNE